MTNRITNADILRAQEARIDSLTLMVEKLTVMHGEALAALTESRKAGASETVELARSGVGGNPTTAKVSVVVREGETLSEASERARLEYEALCRRFPLPNGMAHAAELGDLRAQSEASVHGLRSVPDEEEK